MKFLLLFLLIASLSMMAHFGARPVADDRPTPA
jgi:hypothetical protein